MKRFLKLSALLLGPILLSTVAISCASATNTNNNNNNNNDSPPPDNPPEDNNDFTLQKARNIRQIRSYIEDNPDLNKTIKLKSQASFFTLERGEVLNDLSLLTLENLPPSDGIKIMIKAAQIVKYDDAALDISLEFTKGEGNDFFARQEKYRIGDFFVSQNEVLTDENVLAIKDLALDDETLNKWRKEFPFIFTKGGNELQDFSQVNKGVTYQIFPSAFADSDNNGAGDLTGIQEKIPYLQELGVDSVWLNPINSARSNHRYDVEDYLSIDSELGNLADFRNLIKALKEAGMKVYLGLVPNHTSKFNRLFTTWTSNVVSQQALNSGAGVIDVDKDLYRGGQADFIQFGSEVPQTENKHWSHISGTPLLKKDLKPGQYNAYFSAFETDTLPDLNMRHPAAFKELMKVTKFWIDQGVDGFRLDAVPHIFDEDGEDDLIPNRQIATRVNAAFWRYYASFIKAYDPNIYLIGEALRGSQEISHYTTGQDAFNVPSYFEKLEIFKNENIEILGSDFRGKVDNNQFIVNYLNQIEFDYQKANPDLKWLSSFSSNHDFNRLASTIALVNGKISQEMIAAAFGLQFSLPDKPVIYYGDEIGMLGTRVKNSDVNRRLPMPWESGAVTIQGDDQRTPYPLDEIDKRLVGNYQTVEEAKEGIIFQAVKNLIKFRLANDFYQNPQYQVGSYNFSDPLENKNVLGISYFDMQNKRGYISFTNVSTFTITRPFIGHTALKNIKRTALVQSDPIFKDYQADEQRNLTLPPFQTLVIEVDLN